MSLEQIAHYRVNRLLGAGGMGEVYLAEDETLRRKVALKLLPERFSADGERVRRFQREARAASALNHPNIITIYEIGEAEHRHYIATEYIEGITLRDRIASPDLVTIGEVLNVAVSVANALATAHEAGILHRDIKPENIMLRPDGYVKVLDFGLAKIADSGIKDSTTGSLMGTLHYISPEQARGAVPDARSDIYALGAVLYELLTRRPPHSGDNFVELAISISNDVIAAPSTYAPGLPPEIDRILLKALEKDPQRRYQTARELFDDVRTLRQELEFENKLIHNSSPGLAHQKTEMLTIPPTTSNLRTLVKRKPLSAIAVAAIVLIVIATAVVLIRQNPFKSGPIDSVAVLPFVNATGNADNEYLSDGIAESIIDSLSQLPELRVVARSAVFRYKGRETDPIAVGKELNARGVVTGRLLQRGDTVLIRAALTDVRNGNEVWGQQFEGRGGDVLSLQQEMATAISTNLRRQLSGEERSLLTRRSAVNPEAFQLYLKGRYQLNKYNEQSARRAIELFQASIEADPTYALAYAGLADAYYGLSNIYMPPHDAMPKAREAAKRALELDDSLAQAHMSLAMVQSWYDWDLPKGEAEFRRAIALSPNDADTHRNYSTFLTAAGENDRAIIEARKAIALDPLSVPASYTLARSFFYAGRFEEAKQHLRATRELSDRFSQVYMIEAQIALSEGRSADAIERIETAIAIGGPTSLYIGMRGYIHARLGNRPQAVEAMEALKRRPTYTLPLFLARIHAGLGEHEEAIRWLEKCYSDRSESIVWLRVDPTFAPLRDVAGFQQLMGRATSTRAASSP
jgi:serine/threonine-protein kinase